MDPEQFQKVLEKTLMQQQTVMFENFSKLMSQISGNPIVSASTGMTGSSSTAASSTFKNLSDSMQQFIYDPENNATFERWFNRYESVFTTEAADLTESTKVRLLTSKLSNQDFEQFSNSIMPKKTHEFSLKEAIEKLTSIFGHRQSKFSQRRACLSMLKHESENFAQYAARVNKHCERFDVVKCTSDEFKVQIFVNGLQSQQDSLILEKLLAKLDTESSLLAARQTDQEREAFTRLNLQDLVNEAERVLCLKKDKTSVVESSSKAEVYAVKEKFENRAGSKKMEQKSETLTPRRPCWLCGGMHFVKNCAYTDKMCTDCNQKGHKHGYCNSATSRRSRNVNTNSNADISYKSNQVVGANISQQRKYIVPNVNGSVIKLQFDTGSDVTIISRCNWSKLGRPRLNPTDKQASSATGTSIPLLGSFPCVVKLGDREEYEECYVTSLQINLFGIPWIAAFDLWSHPITTFCNVINGNDSNTLTDEIRRRFPDLFSEELGCCTKTKASLTLKQETRPVYRNARPVPHAARKIVEDELERLQRLGVITPVEYSPSAAPIVVVKKKNGKIRICADYSTGLNDRLEPNQHPLPTPDQIFSKLAGMKVFSSIDLSDAFFQIPLDEEAAKLMTINTHLGLFNVNRLQQGVKTAPGIFQQIIDTMLSGTNTYGFIDDMICAGKDEEDHKTQLFETLKRIQDYGFKLRHDKCKFGVSFVDFCGHVIDQHGIKPHPGKIESLQCLPAPQNVKEVRSFLGAVNYYGKFIHGMKELREPLDELLKKDCKFEWKQKHNKAFNDIKAVLSSDLCLTHFDPQKEVVLATDASEYGMGAALMHEFDDGSLHPIMHFSATFNAAERNYPQMHKEARALVFGLKKAHYYIAGRRFKIHIDHKPLLAIFNPKAGIPMYTAARLQRYATTVLSYDFDIEYINTDSFGYADVISRLMSNHTKPDEDTVIARIQLQEDDDDSNMNCYAIETANMLPVSFTGIQIATKASPGLSKVIKFIENDSWPPKKKQITDFEAADLHQHRNSLTVHDGCIFYGDRIIIPKPYRQQILEDLHYGHPGECRMKLFAAGKLFWPNINSDIERTVKACEKCAISSKTPTKCTLKPWPLPSGPWERIHIDYAGPIEGIFFLVIVDAFSKWPEVFKTTSTTATKTIEFLQAAFAQHGLCNTIVSDNAPQFAGEEFRNFCRSQGIEFINSPPYSPQSNGQAERFVDLLKTGLKKATGNIDQKLREFLTCYRYTPSYNLGMKSPSELLNNRQMKSRLDRIKKRDSLVFHEKLNMENQFNHHHGAKWKEFQIGEKIYFQLHSANKKWTWTPAIIVEKIGTVNYMVQLDLPDNQRIIKAHSNQLKLRYVRNQIADLFEAPEWPDTIEPLIVPHQDDDHQRQVSDGSDEEHSEADTESHDDFQDAEDDGSHLEETIPPAITEPLRRSERANKGIAPRWHQGYQRI